MRKGTHHSETTKRQMSESHKGEKNWNYGKHLSLEHRRNISKAQKGRIPWNKGTKGLYSEEYRRKLSKAKRREKNHNYGKPRSAETRRKISKTNKGKISWKKGFIKENHPHLARSEETKQKISEANKGKRRSMKTRRKMSEAARGEKNHAWIDGRSFLPYSPDFNGVLKRQIKVRDEFTCQLCKIQQDLTVHHINYSKKNNCPKNLITLCRSCNSKVNVNRTYWTIYFNPVERRKRGHRGGASALVITSALLTGTA